MLGAAAELIKRRRHPPPWCRKNMAAQLVVDVHRARLLDELASDEKLRTGLSEMPMCDRAVLSLDAGQLETYLLTCIDPERAIATALCHPDEDVVAVATLYAMGERAIPEPCKAPEVELSSIELVDDADNATSGPGSDSEPTDALEVISAGSDGLTDDYVERIKAVEAQLTTVDELLTSRQLELEQSVAARRELERRLRDAEKRIEQLLEQRITRSIRRRLGKAQSVARERDALLERSGRLENDVAELQASLAAASADREDARTQVADLRRRLALSHQRQTIEWRAEYLRRLLPAETETCLAEADRIAPGPQRTTLARRVQKLRDLSTALEELFSSPSDVDGDREQRGTSLGRLANERREHAADVRVTHDRTLRVTTLGGDREIGGSAILVEVGDTRLLVDAGLRMGHIPEPRDIELALSEPLDAIIVTHAHNDHAGYVPAVVERQRRVEIVASPGTAALLPTMWNDSSRVMARLGEDRSRWDLGYRPPYGDAEVEQAEERVRQLAFGHNRRVRDVEINLFDAGHVLGASGVSVRVGDKHLVITGDIADFEQGSVRGANVPRGLNGADLLICESTYCRGNHVQREREVADLVKAISEVVDGFGRVLIPAFGLGRAQEIALIMRSHLGKVPVLIDGLARGISHIYEDFNTQEGRVLELFGGNIQEVQTHNRRRLIEEFTGGVIITTSGMLNGGFAVPWALKVLPDPHSALFLCGYQDEDAPGSELQRLTRVPSEQRTLTLEPFEGAPESVAVRCRIEHYKLSAHADRHGLIEIIRSVAPSELMLVHGNVPEQMEFRNYLDRAHNISSVNNNVAWTVRNE